MSYRQYKYGTAEPDDTDDFIAKVTGDKNWNKPKQLQEETEVRMVEDPPTTAVKIARVALGVISVILSLAAIAALVYMVVWQHPLKSLWPLAFWGTIALAIFGFLSGVVGVVATITRKNQIKVAFMATSIIFSVGCVFTAILVLLVNADTFHLKDSWANMVHSNPTAVCRFQRDYECSGWEHACGNSSSPSSSSTSSSGSGESWSTASSSSAHRHTSSSAEGGSSSSTSSSAASSMSSGSSSAGSGSAVVSSSSGTGFPTTSSSSATSFPTGGSSSSSASSISFDQGAANALVRPHMLRGKMNRGDLKVELKTNHSRQGSGTDVDECSLCNATQIRSGTSCSVSFHRTLHHRLPIFLGAGLGLAGLCIFASLTAFHSRVRLLEAPALVA